MGKSLDDYTSAEAKLPMPLPPEGRYRELVFFLAYRLELREEAMAEPIASMVTRCHGKPAEQFMADLLNVKRFIASLK